MNELLKIANKCTNEIEDCEGCPFNNDEVIGCMDNLINALANKLEMAYEDLRFSPSCVTCKYFEVDDVCDQCIINNQYRVPTNWKWRGDE